MVWYMLEIFKSENIEFFFSVKQFLMFERMVVRGSINNMILYVYCISERTTEIFQSRFELSDVLSNICVGHIVSLTS